MNINKLLIGVASIALPFGIANAQTPSTSSAVTNAPEASATEGLTTGTTAGSTVTQDSAAAPSTGTDTAAQTDSSTQSASASAAPASSTPVQVSKADVTRGATVSGSDGAVIGKVESVSADAATISTGKARAQIPFASIGKTDKGLVIAMSKTQFEAAASGKSPS